MALTPLLLSLEVSSGMGFLLADADRAVIQPGYGYRLDVHVVRGPIEAGVLWQTAFHNAAHPATQFATGPVKVPGDFSLTRLGVGGRYAVPLGVLRVGGHGEIGVLLFESPMTDDAWQEIEADYSAASSLDPSALGGFVGAGLDLGLAVVPERAWVELHLDAAYDLLGDLGPELGPRVGFTAAL